MNTCEASRLLEALETLARVKLRRGDREKALGVLKGLESGADLPQIVNAISGIVELKELAGILSGVIEVNENLGSLLFC